MNKLTLSISILTAIIVFPSINAFAQDIQADVYNQSAREENEHTLEELEAEYQDKLEYQQQVSEIIDEYEKQSAVYDAANEMVQQLDAGGGTNSEYEYGF
ncbi:MAG: hypothetical protein ACRC1Z_03275 [Waterburya sp.]